MSASASTSDAPAGHPAVTPPGDQVVIDDHGPVERRFAGLDRRTIAPALFVLALAAVMTLALPAIDDAIDYEVEVAAGETIELTAVSFEAAVGWGRLAVDDVAAEGGSAVIERAAVADSTTRFAVTTTTFAGTASELLASAPQLDPELDERRGFHVTSQPASYTTTDGVTGVIERFTGAATEGFVVAFVDDAVGVLVVVSAAENQLREHTSEINDMLDSISFHGPADEEQS